MDKFIKNAAIYLTIKSKKENNYFVLQKINKMKECCERKEYLMNQLKRNQIDLLIIEDSEDISQIGEVEIEKITIV